MPGALWRCKRPSNPAIHAMLSNRVRLIGCGDLMRSGVTPHRGMSGSRLLSSRAFGELGLFVREHPVVDETGQAVGMEIPL